MSPRIQLNSPILDLIEDLAIPALPCIPNLMAREYRRELIAVRSRRRNG